MVEFALALNLSYPKLSFGMAEAVEVLKPLAVFVAGMAVYSIFVYKFYRFLASKDIFRLDLNRYNTAEHTLLKKSLSVFFYIAEYLLIFPIFVFFWLLVLTLLLSFLAKSQPVENILLVSMTLVGAVRVTAYYSEELSKDVAKILPFTLLGIFLFDISYFSVSTSLSILKQVPARLNSLPYYFMFVVALELVLRILHGIWTTISPGQRGQRAQSTSQNL